MTWEASKTLDLNQRAWISAPVNFSGPVLNHRESFGMEYYSTAILLS